MKEETRLTNFLFYGFLIEGLGAEHLRFKIDIVVMII